DVRFPHLYRALAQSGADFLSVPSVFTVPTGRAHWHVLLRSRAIENGCFVFAPAGWGEHAGGRKSYGHSLIVDPWGEGLADGGEWGRRDYHRRDRHGEDCQGARYGAVTAARPRLHTAGGGASFACCRVRSRSVSS